jgi:5-methyltetrahydropteroyltriglutamate--homocysteine methyltransferase
MRRGLVASPANSEYDDMTEAQAGPDFHADHCGSLLRPADLREARRAHALGRLDAERLREIEDRAVLEALALQRKVGLGIYSDGEFRRKFYNQAMETAFEGVVSGGPNFERYPHLRSIDFDENPELAPPNPRVVSRLRARGRIAAHEAAFLQSHAPGPFKITLPSPAMATRAWLRREEGQAAYPTFEALIRDLAALLVDSGVPYIQVDAPGYTRFMLRDRVEQMRRDGIDPVREFDLLVEADNTILRAARRPGVTVAVHICHGTFFLDGKGAAGGGPVNYDPGLTAELYRRLEADRFLVEYTERGGGPQSLRDAPKDKVFALGLLNIRDPRVESADDLMRQVEAAAKYVPLENLALCPSCGFSGAAAGGWVTPDEQTRKLERLVDTARRLWG